MQYLDFDLVIEHDNGLEYRVRVNSQAGQAHGKMLFPFDEQALESRLKDLQIALMASGGLRRKALSREEQTVQEFGRDLFNALISGGVLRNYEGSRLQALQKGVGLRVRLHIDDAMLAALPWEYLYDAHQDEYLCLSRTMPLIRYLDLPTPIQPLTVYPPLHILGMVASPTDQAALDVEHEKQRMRTALATLEERGLVKLTWLEGQTWRDLLGAMRRGPWHVFHFIGHGGFDTATNEGVIALADDGGKAHLMGATELGRVLANHASLRLVILNACEGAHADQRDIFSSTAATLAKRGIPAVLAMQYPITDHAAIECTRTFYDVLADGLPVDAAVAEVRTAINVGIKNSLEWGTPVLYMRSPDGVLFNLTDQPLAQPEAPMAPQAASPQMAPAASAGQETGGAPGVTRSIAAPEIRPRRTTHYTYRGHDDAVTSVAWSPDGKSIASAGFDRTVQVWDVATGGPITTYAGHSDVVSSVAWSPNGRRIASGSWDTTVHLWDAADGKHVLVYRGHKGPVNTVAWSPEGKRILSGGNDCTVQVWRASAPDPIKIIDRNNAEDKFVSMGQIAIIAWSPDGKRIAAAGSTQHGHAAGVLISPEGLYFIGLTYQVPENQQAGIREVSSLAWSPDGKYIAIGGYKAVEVQVGREKVELTYNEENMIKKGGREDLIAERQALIEAQKNPIATHTSHTDQVLAVAWSPDGKRIASGGEDGTVQVWDARTGETFFTYNGHDDGVSSVAWSPDGKLIASGSWDRTVQVWSAE